MYPSYKRSGCLALQVLQSKDDQIRCIQVVLRERDEAYINLLQSQTEETDAFIGLMSQEYNRLKQGQEEALEAVKAAYLQVRLPQSNASIAGRGLLLLSGHFRRSKVPVRNPCASFLIYWWGVQGPNWPHGAFLPVVSLRPPSCSKQARGPNSPSCFDFVDAGECETYSQTPARPHALGEVLQERSELMSAHRAELNTLLDKRSGLEQAFMDQYLKACEAYQDQLEDMRLAEAKEQMALRRRYWAGRRRAIGVMPTASALTLAWFRANMPWGGLQLCVQPSAVCSPPASVPSALV